MCRNVRVVKKLTIKGVTNGIRADLSSSTMWFEDEPGGSWWTCNTSIESLK